MEGNDGRIKLDIPELTRQKVDVFKDLTYHHIINGRTLASHRVGQERIIRRLFDVLCITAAAKWKPGSSYHSDRFEDMLQIIPRFYSELVEKSNYEDATIIRTVADVISGMTEQQAISLYSRFSGERLGSAVDPILF